MRILKKIALIVGIVLALLLIVSLFLPSSYNVERTATVNAPPDSVFALLADLKQWPKWSPWQEADPDMKMEYSATTFGPGASQKWKSEKNGDGKLTIASIMPPNEMRYTFEMLDYGMKADGSFKLQAEGSATKIVWKMEGDMGFNPFGKYYALFMDNMVGPDFEKGLANIKKVYEKK